MLEFLDFVYIALFVFIILVVKDIFEYFLFIRTKTTRNERKFEKKTTHPKLKKMEKVIEKMTIADCNTDTTLNKHSPDCDKASYLYCSENFERLMNLIKAEPLDETESKKLKFLAQCMDENVSFNQDGKNIIYLNASITLLDGTGLNTERKIQANKIQTNHLIAIADDTDNPFNRKIVIYADEVRSPIDTDPADPSKETLTATSTDNIPNPLANPDDNNVYGWKSVFNFFEIKAPKLYLKRIHYYDDQKDTQLTSENGIQEDGNIFVFCNLFDIRARDGETNYFKLTQASNTNAGAMTQPQKGEFRCNKIINRGNFNTGNIDIAGQYDDKEDRSSVPPSGHSVMLAHTYWSSAWNHNPRAQIRTNSAQMNVGWLKVGAYLDVENDMRVVNNLWGNVIESNEYHNNNFIKLNNDLSCDAATGGKICKEDSDDGLKRRDG